MRSEIEPKSGRKVVELPSISNSKVLVIQLLPHQLIIIQANKYLKNNVSLVKMLVEQVHKAHKRPLYKMRFYIVITL